MLAYCPATGFPGNAWASLMSTLLINGSLLLPWVAKTAAVSCLRSAIQGRGVSPALLFQTCKTPYPINHWWCCPFLWIISSVVRLGNYKACKSVGCIPVSGFPITCIFFPIPGSYPGPPIAFSYYVSSISPRLWEFLWIFLVLHDLDTYKEEWQSILWIIPSV